MKTNDSALAFASKSAPDGARRRALRGLFAALTLGLALAACSKRTADLELEAARKAIADAQAKKASDCAHETYQAAEAALAEASKLADAGDVDKAKAKALEAKTLADQASAAAKPDCNEKPPEPAKAANADENASANAKLSLKDVLETIYFDYNEAIIRPDGKAILDRAAEVLAREPNTTIEVEGHCDVRGSTEYNLQLGERRARAVEKYLTAQGVNPKQIQIISYGEERPVDLGMTEEAHAKNRRAELHKGK